MGKTRELVWESLFMADVRGRYFAHMSERLRAYETYLTLVVATLSLGTAVTLLAEWTTAPIILSLLSAVSAAVLTALKIDKRANVGAALSRQWIEIASEYQTLWAKTGELTEEDVLGLAVAAFSANAKMLNRSFEEVTAAHGPRAGSGAASDSAEADDEAEGP